MFAGKEDFKIAYGAKALETMAKPIAECTTQERYWVLVRLIVSGVKKERTNTALRHKRNEQKRVYYFSLEFLIGRLLKNYLLNLEELETVQEGLADLGIDLDELCECEADPGLGNGGLGRLAACFLDSMAYLGVPGTGMGIRYRFGLFRQRIESGWQTEEPDNWMAQGYPWESRVPRDSVKVTFGGHVDRKHLPNGKVEYITKDAQTVVAVPYDVPVVGFEGKTVNELRLWSAEPEVLHLDLAAFNQGDYSGALRERNEIEAISQILYPDDSTEAGRRLRLKQEYFFVAAGVASILRDFKETYGTNWEIFPDKVAIHTNDTHPALCVPELMRLLLDQEGLEWDQAWDITCRTISYTNHTVLPEALETWSIDLMRSLLPRCYMIIEEIDRRYCANFDRSQPDWQERLSNTTILWDGKANMANLSIIGSHSVNGVAALHTEILKADTLRNSYALCPEKFNNKTNGVSYRRFLIESNPSLSKLLTKTIGSDWAYNAAHLQELLEHQDDAELLEALMESKRQNKQRLARYIAKTMELEVDPDSIFDIQVKRIHAYKRQLLYAFKVMDLYNQLEDNPDADIVPQTFIFAGKAAAGYAFAKETIRYICAVADLVNSDPVISKKIKVVFLENFNVSLAQLIYPAADISEQISTAGKEASGTGNMKFMFNGAVTLGTLDGANVEINQLVGPDNIFIFGMNADEVMDLRCSGRYIAYDVCRNNPRLARLCNQLVDGTFHMNFYLIHDALLKANDEYFVLKDFDAYVQAHQSLVEAYEDKQRWARMSLNNIARAGHFSSDRTIQEYCNEIWQTRCDEPN